MHRYEETDARRQAKLKEGRGTGTGRDWLAWIRYGEIASRGNKARQIEGRHGRPVLTLSDVETSLFDVLDCDRRVKEIYDQFPLQLDDTIVIAAELNVEHPRCSTTGTLLTMTSDFVVDYEAPAGRTLVPFQCKHTTNLTDFNSAEHLEIERRYWAHQGKRLRIVTESHRCIPREVRANCEELMQHRFLHLKPSENDRQLTFNQRAELITQRVKQTTARATLNEVTADLAGSTNLPIETFNEVVLNLMYRGVLRFDVRKRGLMSQDVLDIQALTRQAWPEGGDK